jgi:hypothetical protein
MKQNVSFDTRLIYVTIIAIDFIPVILQAACALAGQIRFWQICHPLAASMQLELFRV